MIINDEFSLTLQQVPAEKIREDIIHSVLAPATDSLSGDAKLAADQLLLDIDQKAPMEKVKEDLFHYVIAPAANIKRQEINPEYRPPHGEEDSMDGQDFVNQMTPEERAVWAKACHEWHKKGVPQPSMCRFLPLENPATVSNRTRSVEPIKRQEDEPKYPVINDGEPGSAPLTSVPVGEPIESVHGPAGRPYPPVHGPTLPLENPKPVFNHTDPVEPTPDDRPIDEVYGPPRFGPGPVDLNVTHGHGIPPLAEPVPIKDCPTDAKAREQY